MPYHIEEDHADCPDSEPYAVVKDSDNQVMGCHGSRDAAEDQMAALYAAEENQASRRKTMSTGEALLSKMIDGATSLREVLYGQPAGIPQETARTEPPNEPSKDSPTDRATGLSDLWGRVDWALWEMDGKPWLYDLFLDDDGSIFALASAEGKLYTYPISVDNDSEITIGEPMQVVYDFRPVESRTLVIRQADGNVRWLSISATAILNRVGELDSREIFNSFVTHAETTGEYPYRTFYHQGEAMRYGQCDFLARDGYCFITSGIYDLDGENAVLAEAEIARLADEPDTWGESIGFMVDEEPEALEIMEGVKIPVYNSGYCVEISLLPEDSAASLFTMPMRTEVTRMRDEVKDALTALCKGDEAIVDEFAAKVDSVNRTVQEEGLIAREVACPTCAAKAREEEVAAAETPAEVPTEETPEETPPVEDPKEEETEETPAEETPPAEAPPAEETKEASVEMALDDSAIDAIAEKVGRVLEPVRDDVKSMGEQVGALAEESRQGRDNLNARLEALEKDEEAKREEWRQDLPRAQKVAVTYRPREAKSEETKDKPDQSGSLGEIAESTLSNIRSK